MRNYTHKVKTKTQKSCTVLIEGKDTHDCLKKSEREKKGRNCVTFKK